VLNFGNCIANGLWDFTGYTFIHVALDSVLFFLESEAILSLIIISKNKASYNLAKYTRAD
jgi:hypothetical protein